MYYDLYKYKCIMICIYTYFLIIKIILQRIILDFFIKKEIPFFIKTAFLKLSFQDLIIYDWV
jgi:hypothetical protein